MTNQTVVEENEVETTTQASSPQAEGANTKPETVQDEVAPQENLNEVSDESSDVEVDKTMTPEARKAFQEQRLEIKRLREEMEARKKGESAFDAFRPKVTAGVPDINNFVDPDTGQVNWQGFNQAVVTQAQSAATQTVTEQLDERDARQKFPEVFADPELEEMVAGRWFAAKLNGKELPISQIAESVSRKFSRATTKAEKEGAKRALTELTPKEQASLSVTTQSGTQSQVNADEEEALRTRTRYGSDDSLAKLVGSVAWRK